MQRPPLERREIHPTCRQPYAQRAGACDLTAWCAFRTQSIHVGRIFILIHLTWLLYSCTKWKKMFSGHFSQARFSAIHKLYMLTGPRTGNRTRQTEDPGPVPAIRLAPFYACMLSLRSIYVPRLAPRKSQTFPQMRAWTRTRGFTVDSATSTCGPIRPGPHVM